MAVKINDDNYFDKSMMKKFLSVSQYKSFVGVPAFPGCEARALAELNGDYEKSKSDALLIGSYVDISLTGTDEEMEQFKADNPSMYSSRGETKGQLKSQYQKANKMIDRVKRDKLFMKTLSGESQVIMTGKLFGANWKIKVDSLGSNFITDLKTTESITKTYYDPIANRRVSFIEYYDYVLQMAVYQEIVRQNIGKTLPCFISAVSKEEEPDIAVIQIDNETLADRLSSIEDNVKNITLLKKGKVEPCKCGLCNYCKANKVLQAPINYLDIGGEFGE